MIAILYLTITVLTTARVGQHLFINGIYYLKLLFEEEVANSLNRMLLTGYYLVNVGLVIYTATTWPATQTIAAFIAALAAKTAFILLILGIMHVGNIVWLAWYSAYKNRTSKRI